MKPEHIIINDTDIYLAPLIDDDQFEAMAVRWDGSPMLEGITARSRMRERLSELAMLDTLLTPGTWTLTHNAERAPLLNVNGDVRSISISHTRSHLAMAFPRECNKAVGIDIEHPTSRLQRLAGGYLDHDELNYWARTPERLLMAWTAKEAGYKALGGEAHSVQALRLRHIGSDRATITFGTTEIPVQFLLLPHICIALAKGKVSGPELL